jgi:hypothetical protein
VIQILNFLLASGVGEDVFIAADKRVQVEFAYQQPGLMRRTTAQAADGEWMVVDLWRSAEDADACEEKWDLAPVCQEFMDLLDRTTARSRRYFELD